MADPANTNPKLPTWNGDWRTFSDFKLACYLELDGLKQDEQATLAPRLARNLTGKAWEACLDIDREKLRADKGLDYLLEFLKTKRGKQQVDILGKAFEKYFQSNDVVRQDKENLNDYEQRLQTHLRDIQRALTEIGASDKVPTEIFGWFLLNKHIRLEPSDIATLKSQTATYKLDDVMKALRKMWGGESLAFKNQERKRSGGPSRAYLVEDEAESEQAGDSIWWNDDDEAEEDEQVDENEIWFEEALEALQEDPTDETVLANFQEAKKAFYKDARKALDQNRVNRGFYPAGKGSSKGKSKGSSGKASEFQGHCMRCGKWGHRAQACPQAPKGKGKGTGVGFVFSSWMHASPKAEVQIPETENPKPGPEQTYVASGETSAKAIMDCGASESIVGAWTLQSFHDELQDLGFCPHDEIQLDRHLRKSFVFGNNERSLALGQAKLNVGIHGREQELEAHVVEGPTPLLLSSKWLYEQEAIIDFKRGQALLPKITNEVLQLERASTYHLLLPVTAFQGHEAAKAVTVVKDGESPLLMACAQMCRSHLPDSAEVQE